MKQNPAQASVAGSSPPGALDDIKLCLMAQSFAIAPKDIRYVAFQGGADVLASCSADMWLLLWGMRVKLPRTAKPEPWCRWQPFLPSASMESTRTRPRPKNRA